MPHLHDDPRFQEYHPSSDGLVDRELPMDPLNTRYEPQLQFDENEKARTR